MPYSLSQVSESKTNTAWWHRHISKSPKFLSMYKNSDDTLGIPFLREQHGGVYVVAFIIIIHIDKKIRL